MTIYLWLLAKFELFLNSKYEYQSVINMIILIFRMYRCIYITRKVFDNTILFLHGTYEFIDCVHVNININTQ